MIRLVAAFAIALIAGCAAFDPAAEQTVAIDAMVSEALGAARSPSGEQRAALARAQKRLSKDPSDANRLRLATLLAALPVPLRDDAKAAELLEDMADANSPGFGRFAALLAAQVAERQRLVREAERAARERGRLEREREQADKERDKREEALRQQLEALRSIERGILEREDRLRRKQR